MSDTYRIMCEVSWDYYNNRHGDLTRWEFEMFIKGARCPRCKGETDTPFEPTKLAHIEFGDDDE